MDWGVLGGGKVLLPASYLVIAVMTFGIHHRSARQKTRGTLAKSAFWGAIWPIYWLGPVGPLGTVHKLMDFVVDVAALLSRSIASLSRELLFIYYSGAFLFMPAYQIYLRWDGCDGLWSCASTVVKSFLWGVVWPLYIAVRVFNL